MRLRRLRLNRGLVASAACPAGRLGRALGAPARRPPPAGSPWSGRCGPVPVPGFWPVFGRVPLSPPTKVPGHRPGLSMYWQYGCDHQVVHPADARERGSREVLTTARPAARSATYRNTSKPTLTCKLIGAETSTQAAHPGLGGRGGQDRRSSRKVLSVRRGPLTRATSC